MHRSGFATKREARRWFADHVAPRLRRGAPSADLTYDAFCEVFLERHGTTVAAATRRTLAERLAPSLAVFGTWPLRELEHAANDVAAWRAQLPTTARYRLTSAARQALAAACRWGYTTRNPVADAGRNPQPRLEELHAFTPGEVESLARARPPLRPARGVRRRDRPPHERVGGARAARPRPGGRAVVVQRRYAGGVLTPYPKTQRSGRRVPLTARALSALDALPARADTPLLFPAPRGAHIGLDTWRTREWYPALEAAGLAKRGPYALRHTFAAVVPLIGLPFSRCQNPPILPPGRPLTLARRLAAARSPQPIRSASSTMIPSGPRT